jgi:hypothetical protein
MVKDRFLAAKVIVDDTVFSKPELLYAHTNWGHRYYVIHNQVIEQIVSGKIDVFSNGASPKQNIAWEINDSGLYTVRTLRPAYVRKLPSTEFLKPDNPTLRSLVSDYEPAKRNMQQALRMRSYGVATAVSGSVLAGAGIMLFLLSAFDHANPNGELLQTMGLSSIVAAGLSVGIAFPAFMIRYKRYRIMAIETYNRGSF